jgi:DNA polymerase-3 subunit alpha
MGFPGYFIVMDFIRWAKANGVPKLDRGRFCWLASRCVKHYRPRPHPLRSTIGAPQILNVNSPDFDIDFVLKVVTASIDYVARKLMHVKRFLADYHFGTMAAKQGMRCGACAK